MAVDPKEMKTRHPHPFIAALVTAAETWKQPVCSSGWMDREDVVHTHPVGYCSATTKKGVLPCVTGMDFEGIVLRKSEKDSCYLVSLVGGI